MASYDVDSQYLRESDNLGLMAIRPFGLMLQPQKSFLCRNHPSVH